MSEAIRVSARGKEQYLQLDPPMRDELREHVSLLAPAPMTYLRRRASVSGSPRLIYEYVSRLAAGIRFHLTFEMDEDQLALLDISSSSTTDPVGGK